MVKGEKNKCGSSAVKLAELLQEEELYPPLQMLEEWD